MNKITLGQLLQYYTKEEPCDRIQVVTEEQDWTDAAEVAIDSELLKPFEGYAVEFMSLERSLAGWKPVLRVTIVRWHDDSVVVDDPGCICGGDGWNNADRSGISRTG